MSLPPRKYKTFLTDKDGLSAKDYLLLISTTIFFLFVSIGLILILLQQEVGAMYLDLLDMVSPVVMTVVGGVMGVQAVETFTNSRRQNRASITDNVDESKKVEHVEVIEEEYEPYKNGI